MYAGLVLRFFDLGRGLTQRVGYLTEKPKMLKLPIILLEVTFFVCRVIFGQDKKVSTQFYDFHPKKVILGGALPH